MRFSQADMIHVQREACQQSFSTFVKLAWPVIDTESYRDNWHMDCIADHLMAMHAGEINRLLFNIPPGTSKSSAVSVFFPAWLWGPGQAAKTRFLGASHEKELAERDNMRSSQLIQSKWFQDRWPVKLTRNRADSVHNDNLGFREATSVTGMTGKRGHHVVWDDPHTATAADSDKQRARAVRTFRETLTTRLIDPATSCITVMMQRLHSNDVAGEILEKDFGYTHVMLPMEFEADRCCYTVVLPTWWAKRTGEVPEPIEARYDAQKQVWYGLDDEVPAERKEYVEKAPVQEVYCQDPRMEEGEPLHPKRFPKEVIARDNKALGEYATAGQQQQRPSARTGGILKTTWFDYYNPMQLPAFTHRLIIGDTAQEEKESADNSVFMCFGYTASGQCYLLDLVKDRVEAPELKRMLERFYKKQKLITAPTMGKIRGVKVENAVSGVGLRQTLRKEGMPIVGINRSKDKVARARDVAPWIEAGLVFLPAQAEWLSELLEEVGGFPNFKHDDQVDVLVDGVAELYASKGDPGSLLSALRKAPQA